MKRQLPEELTEAVLATRKMCGEPAGSDYDTAWNDALNALIANYVTSNDTRLDRVARLEGEKAALVSHIEKLESGQIRQVRADEIMIDDDVEVWSCGQWHDSDIVDGWEPDEPTLIRKRQKPDTQKELADVIERAVDPMGDGEAAYTPKGIGIAAAQRVLEQFDVKAKESK